MNHRSALKIALVIARLNIGGSAIQVVTLADEFLKRGYPTILLTGQIPEGEGSLEQLALEKGVTPLKIGALSRRIAWHKDLITLGQLIRIFRREKPLVVHTHTAKAGTLGRIAAIIAGVPVRVHTFHGHVFHGYFPPKLTRFFLAIERSLARHTDRIIAISESQKQELVETYRVAPAEKVIVVPLGFDLDPFLAVNGRVDTFRNSIGCNQGSRLVGWVGRLTAIKDPDLFLNCVRDLARQFRGLRVAMVGDGELRPHCEDLVKTSGLDTCVRFVGWRQDLDCIYADLDFVVLTSINEGTPQCLLEAMASGKSFVATDVGGVRDLMVGPGRKQEGYVVFRNGILAPRDQPVLTRAIAYLLANPEAARSMGQAGRSFVEARFSSQRLTDDLESLYLSLAGSKVKTQMATGKRPGASECTTARKEAL